MFFLSCFLSLLRINGAVVGWYVSCNWLWSCSSWCLALEFSNLLLVFLVRVISLSPKVLSWVVLCFSIFSIFSNFFYFAYFFFFLLFSFLFFLCYSIFSYVGGAFTLFSACLWKQILWSDDDPMNEVCWEHGESCASAEKRFQRKRLEVYTSVPVRDIWAGVVVWGLQCFRVHAGCVQTNTV